MATITFPITKKQVPIGTVVLLALAVLGAFVAAFRFIDGFSQVSNLSDSRPWGIWISFDLLVGVPISAGAFILAAAVHVFHIEKYRPILRPTLLTGFLGYFLVVLALLVDLGQPQRIWHLIIFRNLQSPLFLVGMCEMIYLFVLLLEFSPPVLEKLGWTGLLNFVHRISTPVIILGVTLSILHQSSLGSLFLIMPSKMHPLWYTSLLPLVFLVSSIAVGFGMVLFECTLSHQVFGGEIRKDIFHGLAKGMLVVLSLLLAIKVGDLLLAGELGLVFDGSTQGILFILENLVGIILPIAILLSPKLRQSIRWIFRAGLLTLLGLILYQLNIGLIGMAGVPYAPHWMELAVTVGLFSAGILAFGFAMKNLPLEEENECAHAH